MIAPTLTQADFLKALQAYMPKGRVWPTDASATLTAVLSGLAAVFAYEHAVANALLADSFPANTVNLLPEWQAAVGQVDPLGPTPSNTAQADAFVVQKFAGPAGPSMASILAMAAAYGITVNKIVNRAPFRAGNSKAGQGCGTTDMFYVWEIHYSRGQNQYLPFFAEISPAQSILWGVTDLDLLDTTFILNSSVIG
jgi:uncharacterized protein YmfQ (DUF2313 family)